MAIGTPMLVFALATMFASEAFAQWKPSPFEGEAKRAAIGCSSVYTDESYLCLVVRCDASDKISLYAELTSVEILGRFSLVVDGERFPAEGKVPPAEAPYSNLIEAELPKLLVAMKAGSRIVVDYPELALGAGYETISLRGSSRAIGAVEGLCNPTATKSPVTAAKLLRNSAGQASIKGLTDVPGCIDAEGRGTVVDVERGGPGATINGMWFDDDRYGREFINVDSLRPGPDFQQRKDTLEYLLSPGRRLLTSVKGCGAAARVQELASATEVVR